MLQVNCIIRVDASHTIGNGHLARCLIVAKYLKSKSWKIDFITAEQQSKQIIEQSGFSCKKIEHNDTVPADLISKSRKNIIISDINTPAIYSSQKTYKDYISRIHKQADLLATFEDMIDMPYPADVVIIPYCGAERLEIDRADGLIKYLLGPRYFPLKEDYKDKEKIISKSVKNIAIIMGGSDPEKITLKVLEALNKIKVDVFITVLIGGLSEITDQDITDCSGNIIKNIVIKRDVSNISNIFCESDLAFTNSGLTKYELSAAGVPMIILSNTDQQSKYSDIFASVSGSIHLGYHVIVSNTDIANAYKYICNNYNKRKRMSAKGLTLIDGKGVGLIYKELES